MVILDCSRSKIVGRICSDHDSSLRVTATPLVITMEAMVPTVCVALLIDEDLAGMLTTLARKLCIS